MHDLSINHFTTTHTQLQLLIYLDRFLKTMDYDTQNII